MATTQEQEVLDLVATNMKPKDIAERTGLSIQKVNAIVKSTEKIEAEGDTGVAVTASKKSEAVLVGTQTMTAQDYMDYSEANGRTKFGGEKGKKIPCSIEELRAYINSNMKPSWVMEKYQMDEKDLQQVVWKLSEREMRPKPITYSIEQDWFKR